MISAGCGMTGPACGITGIACGIMGAICGMTGAIWGITGTGWGATVAVCSGTAVGCGCVMNCLYSSDGLIRPVGVLMGVPTCFRDEISVGGSILGTSTFRNFKLISLHAMLNSIKSIFPSASVSARAHIWPNSTGESPDFSRNPFACPPVTIPFTGPRAVNCCSNLSFSLVVTTNGSSAFIVDYFFSNFHYAES